jgi:hypothetical protein
MQIRAGDAQAAGGQRLVAVVLSNGGNGQLDLVVAQLALEGAGGIVVADVDDVADVAELGDVCQVGIGS